MIKRLITTVAKTKDTLINFRGRSLQKIPYELTRARVINRKSSYSQTGEDMIIQHIFEVRGIDRPSYIDIGAHDPYFLNNTATFYLKGSRGINIEPDPVLFKRFVTARSRDVNLNIGVGNKPGTLDFFIMVPPTLNTFSREEAAKYEKVGHRIASTLSVKVDTVENVINKHLGGKSPDLVSIDVEGLDYEILQSIDFKVIKPLVICAETIEYSKDGSGKKDTRIIELLRKNGYEIYADTKINTIFLRRT